MDTDTIDHRLTDHVGLAQARPNYKHTCTRSSNADSNSPTVFEVSQEKRPKHVLNELLSMKWQLNLKTRAKI